MRKLVSKAVIYFVLVWSSIGRAEPVIQNLTGDISDGATVSIQGSGFGEFGGEIISWDDFDAHPAGDFIHNSRPVIGPVWTGLYGYSGPLAEWSDIRSRSGKIGAHIVWNGDEIRAFGWAGIGKTFDRLYISYWRFMVGNFVASQTNHKQFYLYGTEDQKPQLMPLIPAGGERWGLYNNGGGEMLPPGAPASEYNFTNNMNSKGWNWSNTANKFQRWEYWFVLNDVDQPNGTVLVWLDRQLGIENYGYPIRYNSGRFRDFRLGHMARNLGGAEAWFDDLYIATTPARIEICNQPAWSDCNQADIQIADVASWQNNSITLTLRKGGQADLKDAYLYVVDQYGSANQSGYPLGVRPLPPGLHN